MIQTCKNCGKKFERYDRAGMHHNKMHTYKRNYNAINCCKNCSREWKDKLRKIINEKRKYIRTTHKVARQGIGCVPVCKN